jgi:hypothetical protein
VTLPPPGILRFGSFHGRMQSDRQEYTDALALVFGVGLLPLSPELDRTRHFDLGIEAAASAPSLEVTVRPNALQLGGTAARPVITTDALQAELVTDRQPIDIRLTVFREGVPFPELCVHFGVIVHKLLFLLDRVILHAAAVQVDGKVNIFVGDKGAGKSTTTLALARAGGTVLGEDQIVLRRTGSGYLASGGDERSRVTERTERHFFPEPLAVQPKDFAGTMKKEIRMREYFRSEPFTDFSAHRLLFPRVTGSFALKPLKGRAALLRMLGYNGHFQRFEGGRDQAEFLEFLSGFIASVTCWELSLSDDLVELDRLAEMLRGA